MSASNLKPESPCVGRCSTTYGDDVCKGCGRTFEEVINWIIFDEVEKAAIWARLEKLALSS
jgi:hypothetical protein